MSNHCHLCDSEIDGTMDHLVDHISDNHALFDMIVAEATTGGEI
jgi:hypothetical protein